MKSRNERWDEIETGVAEAVSDMARAGRIEDEPDEWTVRGWTDEPDDEVTGRMCEDEVDVEFGRRMWKVYAGWARASRSE